MAWVEAHQSLAKHRKTLRAAAILGVDRHKIIGHLLELWWWAVDNVGADGCLDDIDDATLAAGAEWGGDAAEFVAALTTVGFIDGGERRFLHDWRSYAGRLHDLRAYNAARKRVSRARHQGEAGQDGDGHVDSHGGVPGTVTEASRGRPGDSHNGNVTRPVQPDPTQPDPTQPATPLALALPSSKPTASRRVAPTSPPLKADENAGPTRGEVSRQCWDVFTELQGFSVTTPSARGARNKAIADILGVGGTPEQIREVWAEAERRRWKPEMLTPTALAKHWDELRAPPPRRNAAQSAAPTPNGKLFCPLCSDEAGLCGCSVEEASRLSTWEEAAWGVLGGRWGVTAEELKEIAAAGSPEVWLAGRAEAVRR